MSQTWVQCLESLKNTLPLGEFSVWVKPLKAAERNETLYLYAPSASALKYINNHKNLEAAIILAVSEFDRKLKVRFGVVDSSKKIAGQTKHHTTPLFPEYTFDSLVLGSANQVAALASRQIAEKIGASLNASCRTPGVRKKSKYKNNLRSVNGFCKKYYNQP